MAQQHKSAGDGTTPGSVAQTGLQTLPEVSAARPGEGLLPSTFAKTLESCTQRAYELGALVDTIHKLTQGDEEAVGRAELLAGLASRDADDFADYLCGVETDFRKLNLEASHG